MTRTKMLKKWIPSYFKKVNGKRKRINGYWKLYADESKSNRKTLPI